MFDAILSLDLALSIFCGLFGLHMLRIAMARKTPAIFLAFIFLLLAIHAILLNVILNFDRPPLAASLLPVIPVLIGPLLLLFFQSARALDYRFQRLQALHAAPAVIVFLQMSSGVLIEWVDMIVIGSIFFLHDPIVMDRLQRRRSISSSRRASLCRVFLARRQHWVSVLIARSGCRYSG